MPQPILFRLLSGHGGAGRLGVGPSLLGRAPAPPTYLRIFGVTYDSVGAPLGGCTVHLMRTADDSFVDLVVSDGGGNYEFRSPSLSTAYYVVAYKPGSPDLAGTTVNTLVGT